MPRAQTSPIDLARGIKDHIHSPANGKRKLTSTGTLGTVDTDRVVCSLCCHDVCGSSREINVLDTVT